MISNAFHIKTEKRPAASAFFLIESFYANTQSIVKQTKKGKNKEFFFRYAFPVKANKVDLFEKHRKTFQSKAQKKKKGTWHKAQSTSNFIPNRVQN